MAQGLGIAIHALNWKSLGLQKAYEAGILRVLEFHRISSEVSRVNSPGRKSCQELKRFKSTLWAAKHAYEALPTNQIILRRWALEVGLRKSIELLKV